MNPLQKYHEQLARVQHMEDLCHKIQTALASDDHQYERLLALEDIIQELTAYYESPQWLEDFHAERCHTFPQDMPRGILAEDTIYNLLSDIDAIIDAQKRLE